MIRRFNGKFGDMILALTVAVLLYFVAYSQRNPHESRDIYVAPEPVGLPRDLVLKSKPNGVTVTVGGPAETIDTLRSTNVKATVDLSQAKPGTTRIPIDVSFPPGVQPRVTVDNGPVYAEVVLEKKTRQTYTPDVSYTDNPPAGYAYGDYETEPSSVAVEGLASQVAKVGRVVALVDNAQNKGAIDQTVELVAQDSQRRDINDVSITPSEVRVRVPLKLTPAQKQLILSAELEGIPAPGFYVAGYTFTPTMLTVSGRQETLAPRSSLSIPIDIAGMNASETRSILVTPPPGTAVKGSARVSLRLDVRPIVATPGLSPAPPRPRDTPSPLPIPSASASPNR